MILGYCPEDATCMRLSCVDEQDSPLHCYRSALTKVKVDNTGQAGQAGQHRPSHLTKKGVPGQWKVRGSPGARAALHGKRALWWGSRHWMARWGGSCEVTGPCSPKVKAIGHAEHNRHSSNLASSSHRILGELGNKCRRRRRSRREEEENVVSDSPRQWR